MEAADVAVCPFLEPLLKEETNERVEVDFANVPLYGPDDMTYTGGAGLGDEVWAVGLFRSHFGRERNIPIVRMGNIVAMRGEPVFTEFGDIDAYLVETRSIGGLSGSPVFVSVRTDRIGIRAIRLLGLVHGHFDVKNLNEDVVTDDEAETTTGIHTGIGIVVPVHKIVETIEHPDLTEMRKANAARMRQEGLGE